MLKTSLPKCLIAVPLLLAGMANIANAQHSKTPKKPQDASVQHINPPVSSFYSKYLDCRRIPIRSSDAVSDSALYVARQKMQKMLIHIPVALHNLVQWGSEVHIIGRNQQTSDLPEFRPLKGVIYTDNLGVKTDIDTRTRGEGGIYTSCGEENLLNLPGDRYAGGQDICTHEFAHDIMDFGLDSLLQKKIKDRYLKAVKAGLWKNAYAAVNESEYWAELSMWYFGQHGEFLKSTKSPAPGPDGLRQYDSGGYSLLDSIYSGKLSIASVMVNPAEKITEISPSSPSTQTASVMLVNQSAKPVKLFWIGYDGKPVSYGGAAAYNANLFSTYTSHLWEIEDESGKSLGYYRVNSANCRITIPAR